MMRTAWYYPAKKFREFRVVATCGQINCDDDCFRLNPKFNVHCTETQTNEMSTILLGHSETANLHSENSDGATINAIQAAIRRSVNPRSVKYRASANQ